MWLARWGTGILCMLCFAANAHAVPKHALTLFGEPKYKAGFTHTDYVNPSAPKGGTLKLASPGSYDSLNPFILKGIAAPGISLIYESLMTKSLDEPLTYYGLIAESVDVAEDNTSATFRLRKNAHWHDGKPIIADDVLFTYEALTTMGHPAYRVLLAPIQSVKKINDHTVEFTFADPTNRENATTAASMTVLPRHYYQSVPFDKTTLEPPLGSGPYKISTVDQGRSITYERAEEYWGKTLPIRVGTHNFERVRYDIYRDETVSLEALKSGQYDVREEYIARNWATAYDIPAIERGELKKEMVPHQVPRGMQAFLFNQRKAKFQDRRVRRAISLAMDFEWMNETLFYGAYDRSNSFFQNTQFMATGTPKGDELALLEPHRDALPPALFTEPYIQTPTDGSGHARGRLIEAQSLLKEAGWVMGEDGQRTHEDTGELLTVEFLMRQRTFQRVITLMQKNLKRLGVASTFRYVDDAQYQKRIDDRDFDIINIWWNLGVLFPGNEQISYWHSSQADVAGSNNLSGTDSVVIDALLDRLIAASTLEELRASARALDRTLLWEHAVIPHWHLAFWRLAYWDRFGKPDIQPPYDIGIMTWWAKDATMEEK